MLILLIEYFFSLLYPRVTEIILGDGKMLSNAANPIKIGQCAPISQSVHLQMILFLSAAAVFVCANVISIDHVKRINQRIFSVFVSVISKRIELESCGWSQIVENFMLITNLS